MDAAPPVIFIDSDVRRRAKISHALANVGIHVEPFETVEELAQGWPRSGVILVEDGEASVSRLIAAMADHGEWFPIIAFGEHPSTERIVAAVLDGAVEYIAWPFTPAEITHAISRATQREHSLGNARMREAMARGRIERLTERERQVLDCVANGLSNRMIGERLRISPRTVEIHRANMLNKLGAQHTSQAIRIAIEAGLAH